MFCVVATAMSTAESKNEIDEAFKAIHQQINGSKCKNKYSYQGLEEAMRLCDTAQVSE